MADGEPRYVHGTDPQEQERLSRMNAFINQPALAKLNLQGHEKVLDLGCGLAQLSAAMATVLQAAGSVLGIEQSREQLQEARQRLATDRPRLQNLELRQGNALQPPLEAGEWQQFDLVHARFLLEHLTDPMAAVEIMWEAAKPGGRLVLQDDDHQVLRMWPDVPKVMDLWQRYVALYPKRGMDPFVGRRLVQLLHQAGAEALHNDFLFFGACSGDPIFPDVVNNFAGVLVSAKQDLLDQGVSASFFEQTISELKQWGTRPDAALWYPICWAEGRKPIEP
ncbi:MAG: methyltransferase domain-containing protein [Planctomycetota bacterium]|nr:MAG: methyltransferase domain-containing protein [Planctomycetota bacterium]